MSGLQYIGDFRPAKFMNYTKQWRREGERERDWMGFDQSLRQFDGRSSQRFSTCWRLQAGVHACSLQLADWPQVYWTENKFWCLSNRRLAVFRLYQQFCPEDGALIPVEAGVDSHVERLEWRGSGGAKEALEVPTI